MKQPIAGVVPSAQAEATITTIWPSIAAYPSGQWIGRLCGLKWPDVYIFRIGHLLALALIPHALFLYFSRVAPKIGMRYRLTNRRVVVERGIGGEREERAIGLTAFDTIKTDVLDGQQWYDAADLVFLHGDSEVFRLEGVSRPEPYRQTVLKARQAHCSVAEVLRQQAQPAPV